MVEWVSSNWDFSHRSVPIGVTLWRCSIWTNPSATICSPLFSSSAVHLTPLNSVGKMVRIEMWGRAFIPGVDDLHGAASVTEIQVSTPFVAIENKAPADRAHNLHGKTAAVEITTGQRTRPHTVSWLEHMFTLATILFFILPRSVLNLIGWHYIGGGAEYQKVHIATYLLITTFICLWLIDPRFRGNVTHLCCTDWTLILFAFAVGTTASYAVLVKHVPITPFVDTFLAALLVTIGWICLPPKNLRLLRYLLDIYFVTSIAILFLEYGTKSWVISRLRRLQPIQGKRIFRTSAFGEQFCLACIPSLT